MTRNADPSIHLALVGLKRSVEAEELTCADGQAERAVSADELAAFADGLGLWDRTLAGRL